MAISEKRKVYLAKWREKHRERLKQVSLDCYYRHHDRRKAESREKARLRRRKAGQLTRAEWYKKTGRGITEDERRRRRCESVRRYRQAHPEKVRALDFINNSRRRGFDVRCLSEAVIMRLEFYGNRCVFCGSKENLEIDHIKPLKHGGSHLPCNLAPLCKKCNMKKHDKWSGPHDWIKRRDYGVSLAAITPETAPSPAHCG